MPALYQFLPEAKRAFAFLSTYGLAIEVEREGTYASFKDGFTLVWASKGLSVEVTYHDMELEVIFRRGGVSASYLFLDHNLHANASGFAGCMFPFEKLTPVIDAIAKDIEAHYEDVLRSDFEVWRKIEKLVLAPKETKPFLP
ncbi:MAG TPA: hypothetical protein VGD88_14485 [Opitutaceae bacterium]